MNTLLENLPDINFAVKDTEQIAAEVIARFEKDVDRTLFPGDPWRQALLTVVYFLSMQRSKIDFTGKQNLLAFSGEGFIEHIGALVLGENPRLKPTPSITTLEFTISQAMPSNTTIGAGTRATPGNNLYFTTTEDVEIPAGELRVEAPAECSQVGKIGNGFLPGQINRIVDSFPFTYSVQNTTISQGGANKEDLEPFRERIRMAPESYSTAGPYGAYEFWARTANQLIVDVRVKSPSPGVVDVVTLLRNGEIPSQSILDEVYAVLSADHRRPLTDKVVSRAAEPVKYPLKFTYYISRRDAPLGMVLQERVDKAVDDYILWQKSSLGRDITPSTLVEMVKATGIKRVDLDTILPEFTVLQYYEIGVVDEDNIEVIYGGIEDD